MFLSRVFLQLIYNKNTTQRRNISHSTKIQHKNTTPIKHKNNTRLKIQHRVAILGEFRVIAPLLALNCKKVTTKFGEISFLIRHMYILRYIVIRTNRYIIMHALRGVVVLQIAYRGSTECLSEHVYTTRIQHKIHTICLYKTAIQQIIFYNTLKYNKKFIQHVYTTRWYNTQIETFQKAENKKVKKDNFIQHE